MVSELHSLIHSLSPSEKRYFKLFAQFSGQKPNNNYIRLFDRLNEMSEFDAGSIDKWIQKTSFASHPGTTVNFLMRLILRSLKLYHSERSRQAKARESLDFASLLVEKGRYGLAQKYLQRARKRAEQIGATLLLMEIFELERKLLFKSETRSIDRKLQALLADQAQQMEHLRAQVKLENLKDRYRSLRQRDNSLRAPERVRRLELLRQEGLDPLPDHQDLRTRLHFHTLQSQFAIQERNYRLAFFHARQNIGLWESHPEQIPESPGLYIQHLSDFLNTCILALEREEAQKALNRIREVEVRTHDDKIELLKQSLSTQLIFCLNAGDQTIGNEVVRNIEQLLASHGELIPLRRRFSFYYNITTFHFYKEDYSKALRSLNRILNASSTEIGQGLQSFARIFQIVLHLELGDPDLAEYLLRSALNLHKRRKRLFELEKEIFDTLRTYIFAHSPNPLPELLRPHFERLLSLAENPSGKEPPGTWEFIFWLQSKVEHRSLSDVYQERVRTRWELPLNQ